MAILTSLEKKLRIWRARAYVGHRGRSHSQKLLSGEPVNYNLPRGIEIRLYPVGQIAEQMYTARHERSELAFVAAHLKPGMNVLDIGANIGLYSLMADKLVGPSGQVWAFEPSSETFGRLTRNLSLNQATSVTPVQMALSHEPGKLLLKRDAGYGDGERYLLPGGDGALSGEPTTDAGDTEEVAVGTLDHFFGDGNASPRIDFVKMDVEGNEYHVFRGARRLLTSNPDIAVMFEFTIEGCMRSGHSQEEVAAFLNNLGFELYGWDRAAQRWETRRELVFKVGNVWATRSKDRLPALASS
jgi:FkbM family methyltransferase